VGEDQPVETYRGHTDTVYSLAWDPRGGVLASGSWDRTVRTWRPDSASPALATLTGHRGEVNDTDSDSVIEVVWRPGTLGILASWDQSGKVMVWDFGAGTSLFTLPYPGRGIGVMGRLQSYISFSPDGQLLAARGEEVRVWRAETGELALVCRVVGDMVSWSPGGDRLAVSTREGVSVFKLSMSLKSLAALAVASCLRGRGAEGLGKLELPDTLKQEVGLLL
jgi:WD40 repeat protein